MTIQEIRTRNFTVRITAEPDLDADLSYDETGEVARNVASGKWICFAARAVVSFHGVEIAERWLGECIYEDPMQFERRQRRDLVSDAIREARDFLADAKEVAI